MSLRLAEMPSTALSIWYRGGAGQAGFKEHKAAVPPQDMPIQNFNVDRLHDIEQMSATSCYSDTPYRGTAGEPRNFGASPIRVGGRGQNVYRLL
jgi:hypothetical protein